MPACRLTFLFVATLLCIGTVRPVAAEDLLPIVEPKRDKPVDFDRELLPVLKRNCLACHNATTKEGKLSLETPQAILAGGDNGPAAKAKQSAESLLLLRARGGGDGLMPPEDNKVAARPLSAEELGLLKLWIDQGAAGSVSQAETIHWQSLPPGVNPIYALAITPDGQYAACGRANQIFIYRISTGELIGRLTDPELLKSGPYEHPGVADLDLIQSLAFSPDGGTLASGGFRAVKLWSRPRNVQVASWSLPTKVPVLAISPDRKLLASAGRDHGIDLLEPTSGKFLRYLSGHRDRLTSLSFAPDSKSLVSASADGSLAVWSIDREQPIARIEPPQPSTTAVFVAGGNRIASAGADGLVRVWLNPATVTGLWQAKGAVVVAAASGDRKHVALGRADGVVVVLEAATGKERARLKTDAKKSPVLALDAQAKRVAVAATDRDPEVFDAASGKPLFTLTRGKTSLTALAFDPQSDTLIGGAADGSMRVWKLKGAGPIEPDAKAFEPFNASIVALTFSPGERGILLAGAADGTIRRLQLDSRKTLSSASHGKQLAALAVSLDGKLLATRGADNLVRLFQAATLKPATPATLGPIEGAAGVLDFSADGTRLLSGTSRGVVVYKLAKGQIEQRFSEVGPAPVYASTVPAQPNRVLLAGSEGTTLRALAAEQVLAGHDKPVASLAALNRNPTRLVSAGADGRAILWDTAAGKELKRFDHRGPIAALAVSPDDARLITAGRDKIARLWNLADGKQLAELRGDTAAITLVSERQRQVNVQQNIIAAKKSAVTDADKRATVEAGNVKKSAETETSEQKTLTAKVEAEQKATTEKQAADKTRDEAQAAATAAVDKKSKSDAALKAAEQSLPQAERVAADARTAAKKKPDDKALLEAAVEAEQALAKAREAVTMARQTQADAQRGVTSTTAKQTEAQTAATAKEKALDEATKARTAAEAAKAAAAKGHQMAEATAKKSQLQIADTKSSLTAAEAALKQAQEALAAAQKQATDSESPFTSVAFSPDGKQLATGNEARRVHTWLTENGTALDTFTSASPLGALVYASPTELIAADTAGRAIVWNLQPAWTWKRTLGASGTEFADRVTALDFSPDGRLLATGGGAPSRSGELKLWNVADGRMVREIPDAHSDTVFCVSFSPDGRLLASSAADKFIKVFNVETGKFVRAFEGHTHHVLAVSWQADGRLLASGGADNAVKVWDFETGEQQRTINTFGKEVTSLHFVGDSPNVLGTSGDRSVRLLRVSDGQNVRSFNGATDYLYCGAATPDGKIIVAGGQDSVLRVWNGDNGQTIRNFDPPAPPETKR